jgi:6-pyruvoyltetrahydropterin/6-carboxytetrahydropterin synthase
VAGSPVWAFMYELITIDEFSAAHRLKGYPGKCEKLHGHNWKVEVRVRSHVLDTVGMVKDFTALKEMTTKVLKDLDHCDLNALPAFENQNPSAENLARYIYEGLKVELAGSTARIHKVLVWESETTAAVYFEDGD